MTLALTKHGAERLAQRGIQVSDLDLIVQIGSEVEGGFLVRKSDLQEAERQIKRLLDRIRRLKGKRLVVGDGSLVTAYHADRREERRLLRGAPRRDLRKTKG
jgi:hypothetical protein